MEDRTHTKVVLTIIRALRSAQRPPVTPEMQNAFSALASALLRELKADKGDAE